MGGYNRAIISPLFLLSTTAARGAHVRFKIFGIGLSGPDVFGSTWPPFEPYMAVLKLADCVFIFSKCLGVNMFELTYCDVAMLVAFVVVYYLY